MSIECNLSTHSRVSHRIKEIEKCLEYIEKCEDLIMYDNYESTKSDLEAHLHLLRDQLKYEVAL